ncbi:hypothetical protein [Micromonospora tarensis]|uniref:Uncharacterized protein n=1 Tax=Micromonospora tarensis TaxID=2806100 RepID=A0ABS1YD68_9ACTN|nr:hypothetical protein [Micromonospora tarensis]MBM0275350.1 hypothetical protein [Micromonospora tarensis]
MGARLVSLVLARWTHLPDRAFRVVVKMAHTALDEPSEGKPAAIYFAGRDPLIAVLRSERGGDRDTLDRTLKRAIGDLIKDMAVERVSAGRAGSNAVYRLTLLNTPASIGVRPCTVEIQGDTGGPVRGTAGVPPRNQEEPLEEPREEERRTVLPVDLAVVTTGGTLPPDPLRPQDPKTGDLGNESESATSDGGDQPPQPDTATHDRARETPHLRLVQPASRGFGFCLACHADGHVTLAADPVNGDACLTHIRNAS